MSTYSTRTHRTWLLLLIALLALSLVLGATLVLGQGGTGRETPNTNSNKKPPAPKKTTETKKAPIKRSPTSAKPTAEIDRKLADLKKKRKALLAIYSPEWPEVKDLDAQIKLLEKQREELLGKIAGPGKAGSIVRNQIGMELVWIPPGSFMMGSENGASDEKPVHLVTISNGFYIGKHEVTQAQWQAVMGNNPSSFKACGGNCPVETVTWDDAQKFIQRLNGLNDGYIYRLPTEAKWEYACRAGTTGDDAGNLSEMAWFAENSGNKTHAVGGKRPNYWGLADMHGNVWEWCQDWYHETYFGAPTDGSAWLSRGELKYRVLRGGSWGNNATLLLSAARFVNPPGYRNGYIGFRLVAVGRTQ